MHARTLLYRTLGALIPTASFVAVAAAGFSVVTMLPHTARAGGGCTVCTHAVTHWTCGPTNLDNIVCNKLGAALCHNNPATCVGSTTQISGGGLDADGGDDLSISTTTL
jgi:hypothetical protein